MNNLSQDEKKLFLNSPFLLEKMLQKIERKIKRVNNNISINNISGKSSHKENASFSFISSLGLSNK